MPAPSHQILFQIHRSTAVMLLLAVSALIWANVNVKFIAGPEGLPLRTFGWPLVFMTSNPPERVAEEDASPLLQSERTHPVIAAAVDLTIAIAVLWFVHFAGEWLIRRPAARKALEMSDPLRPKRFQLHLSTAVVMMFVAGSLIYANLRLRISRPQSADGGYLCTIGYGFPLYALETVTDFYPYMGDEQAALERVERSKAALEAFKIYGPQHIHVGPEGAFSSPEPMWFARKPIAVAVDLVFAVALLATVWFLSEWLIRHRAQASTF